MSKGKYGSYLIGIILVIIPVFFEQTNNSLDKMLSTTLLIGGLIFLLIGKGIKLLQDKKLQEDNQERSSSVYLDIIIIFALFFIIGFIVYKSFM